MLRTLTALLLTCFAGTACGQENRKVLLPPNEFYNRLADTTAQLLDVRTAAEFRRGYLAHAMQANWNDTAEFNKRTSHLDKKRPVYVYCQVGGRSAAAADQLLRSGFQVFELDGGVSRWKNAGLPMITPEQVAGYSIEDYSKLIPEMGFTLVNIGGEWCPPCRAMQPVLDSLTRRPAIAFKLVTIDAAIHTELTTALGVEALPTYIIYRNGKEHWRGTGIQSLNALETRLR